jgi:Ni,Fe-hydrogenase I cytochrome b subunit
MKKIVLSCQVFLAIILLLFTGLCIQETFRQESLFGFLSYVVITLGWGLGALAVIISIKYFINNIKDYE